MGVRFKTTAGPLTCDPCYGELTINDVSLHTPAWCATDLSELWGSFDLRGANRVIPGARGRRAFVRRVDETKYSIPLLITGYCDANGVPWAEDVEDTPDVYDDIYDDVYQGFATGFMAGLELNVNALQTAFYLDDPTGVTYSLLDAVFTLPSGATRTTQVQVVGLRGRLAPGALMRATLDIVDVYGGLSLAAAP